MGSLLKALPVPYWLSKPSEIYFWFHHGDWGTWKMFSVKFEKGFSRKWSREVKVKLCEEEEELWEWRPVTNRNRNNRWELPLKERWKNKNRKIGGGGGGGGVPSFWTFGKKLLSNLCLYHSPIHILQFFPTLVWHRPPFMNNVKNTAKLVNWGIPKSSRKERGRILQ